MLTNGILAAFFVWLLLITFFLYKTRAHYRKLTTTTKKRKIDDILDSLVDSDHKAASDIEKIKKSTDEIIDRGKQHFQKIGFVRFNPFERVGGEQSFIVCLLDEENSGIILNFLYTREGIRVYAKKIKKGKSEEYELSSEEKEAIKKAK